MRDTIETNRLTLRPFTQEDWKSLVNYAGDIDVARATGRLPHPYSSADATNWIELTQTDHGDYIYGIALKDGHLIGAVSLMKYDSDKDQAWELGYWLGQAYWHKAYMREATTALLDEARIYLAPINLIAHVFTDNPRSLNLLLHLGFKPNAMTSLFCVARGHDVETSQLTRSLGGLSPCAT